MIIEIPYSQNCIKKIFFEITSTLASSGSRFLFKKYDVDVIIDKMFTENILLQQKFLESCFQLENNVFQSSKNLNIFYKSNFF